MDLLPRYSFALCTHPLALTSRAARPFFSTFFLSPDYLFRFRQKRKDRRELFCGKLIFPFSNLNAHPFKLTFLPSKLIFFLSKLYSTMQNTYFAS